VSVVDASFERLKRFNLAEIFDPTPKEMTSERSEHVAAPAEVASAMTSAAQSISMDSSGVP